MNPHITKTKTNSCCASGQEGRFENSTVIEFDAGGASHESIMEHIAGYSKVLVPKHILTLHRS